MADLNDRRIVLGVTGGIAAYKAAELTRLLVKEGAAVDVVLSAAGARFVGPVTFQALSGNPVRMDLWDPAVPNNMAHIDLTRGADAVVVAPASADFLARVANGMADDLLTTLCLARPRATALLAAPAMNREMWDNPATQRNLARLREDGVTVLGPACGDQACGETGLGRMLEADELLEEIVAYFQPKELDGVRMLVTAGPTFEPLDPVRGLSNLSSGKMGFAVARAAAEAGAEVTLVAGPVSQPTPRRVARVDVTTALQMREAVLDRIPGCHVFVSVAAVADYRPATAAPQKIKKGVQERTLALVANPDILAEVAALPKPPFCVGFAAESENLAEYAEAKRQAKKLPLLVGNLVQHGLGRDENTVILFEDRGQHPIPPGSKLAVAREIVARIARRLR
ncbi:MAG TPA: bifunctional phosphopantothenoylcysteine decarboxylase/phosphopantothenate--cysteine ligase CoaBC [Rhodocyclaceae bacterium]|jgi:phosphopantothenoylcysteine decarboxylase/phosphopantothenate--cysteine ligase|nr:bifunctional phosphopantothenoylcysteine decarboxylase/phosphopantothenate--cysteine ligase CoaBC [Rhodocyclaceae bacterium]